MMLSKVSRGITILAGKLNDPASLKVGSIVFLNGSRISKRDFSIDDIGKRYDKPWDYKKKDYALWGQITDSTLKKLGENSLIITVEGNFGSGKSQFAQKLAKDIDFVSAKEPDLDRHLFQLSNGSNVREIVNEYVGDNERFHVDSLEEWHRAPSFKNTIFMQNSFYSIRWMQTRTALLHLMSTGQGVILERSVFSDTVIGQALYDHNFISDEAYRFYLRDLVESTLHELWRPHVVIYLDRTPEECLKNIKNNGKPFEKESKIYTLDLLKSVEKNYKNVFLPQIRNHLHVLSYKSDELDTEKVIDDLERLDFEDQHKFNDWRIRKEMTINAYRRFLSNYTDCLKLLTSATSFIDVPEYLLNGEDLVKLQNALDNDARLNKTNASLFSPLKNMAERREWL